MRAVKAASASGVIVGNLAVEDMGRLWARRSRRSRNVVASHRAGPPLHKAESRAARAARGMGLRGRLGRYDRLARARISRRIGAPPGAPRPRERSPGALQARE